MIDPSTRLRRAIHLNDLILVQRIVKSNPQTLRDPDPTDRNNTALHLAAILGYTAIAVRIHTNQDPSIPPLSLHNKDSTSKRGRILRPGLAFPANVARRPGIPRRRRPRGRERFAQRGRQHAAARGRGRPPARRGGAAGDAVPAVHSLAQQAGRRRRTHPTPRSRFPCRRPFARPLASTV